MASRDSESGFQTPASKKRKASESPSLPLAGQSNMPPTSYKTGLHLLLKVLTQNTIHNWESWANWGSTIQASEFSNSSSLKMAGFYRRHSQRFRHPAEWTKNAASFWEKR